MNDEDPDLDALTRRLAETPPEFLDEPVVAGGGRVAAAAVVNDLLRMHGARASLEALAPFAGTDPRADRNRLALVLIGAWLLADENFLVLGPGQAALLDALDGVTRELAPQAAAHRYVEDAERREELARTLLARLGLRPYGETPAQAADRLAAVSGEQRRRLLAASRAAERRAREIREALARKAAEESADKWTRE